MLREAVMEPAQDPLYRIHQLQAERLGEVALPYETFRATMVMKDSADLDLLVFPPTDERRKANVQSDQLFNLGTVCIMGNVAAVVPPDEILRAVERHSEGDWGLFEYAGLNELALHRGSWLLSTYRSSGGVVFWVVTNPDRALTSVVFRKGDR